MAKLILKTDKKKLEIKKSSIINFTLNELQMGLIVGGILPASRKPSKFDNNCTSNIINKL